MTAANITWSRRATRGRRRGNAVSRGPFHLLRAAFYLLAALVLTELLMTVIAGVSCVWLVVSGRYEPGACSSITSQIREVWAEMLAAILALLLAGRKPDE